MISSWAGLHVLLSAHGSAHGRQMQLCGSWLVAEHGWGSKFGAGNLSFSNTQNSNQAHACNATQNTTQTKVIDVCKHHVMESALSKLARELEQGVWDSPYRHCLLLMGLPLPPRLKFWACNLKGVPTMINSYMTWDGGWHTSAPLFYSHH